MSALKRKKLSSEKKNSALLGIRGKPFLWQSREIIANVINFFKKESQYGLQIPLIYYGSRTIEATGITEKAYRCIIREIDGIENGENQQYQKKFIRKSINLTMIKIIRQLIHNFYIMEKRPPTIQCLMAKVRDNNINFDGNQSILRNFTRKIGFQLASSLDDNRKILIENYNIRYQRIHYIKQLLQYRKENRPIVYISEKRFNYCSTINEELCVIHAGGEMGFLPNCLSIITPEMLKSNYGKCSTKSKLFTKWLEKKLIPNLPSKCILIIDTPTCRNLHIKKQLEFVKDDMFEWLQSRNIPCFNDMTKLELSILIKEFKLQNPTYKLDEFVQKYDHNTLKLPRFHYELSPFEKIWEMINDCLTNCDTNRENLHDLLRQKFNCIEINDWLRYCNDVKRIELEFLQNENVFDEVTDELQISIDDHHDIDKDDRNVNDIMDIDESCSSGSCSDYDDDDDDDEIDVTKTIKEEEISDDDDDEAGNIPKQLKISDVNDELMGIMEVKPLNIDIKQEIKAEF